ncbi:hypothetical protein ACWEQ8_26995 [Streptomyces noursei]
MSSSSPPFTTACGSQFVRDHLCVEPRQLPRQHAPGSVEETLAQLVKSAAVQLDDLAAEFASRAKSAAVDLTRVATGKALINSLGVLQNSATAIDILAARRADAMAHLKELVNAYQYVTAHEAATRKHTPQAANLKAPPEPPSSRPGPRR